MAAYAAVISLKHVINGLKKFSRIFTRKTLEFAYNQTTCLQQVLESSNDSSNKRLDGLEGQIRDCANELEDVLEFHELNAIEDKYEDEDEEVWKQIISFTQKVKKLEKDYIDELSKPAEGDDRDDDADATIISPNIDFGVELVGHSSEFNSIWGTMISRMRPNDLCFYSSLGEVGTGRTLMAKIIYDDMHKGGEQSFDFFAWVPVGTKPRLKEVLIGILVQAYTYENLISEEDEKLGEYLNILLENRRYMIVLDDVHDVEMVEYLGRSLPDQSNGSLVFITTSLMEVALLTDHCSQCNIPAPMFEECTWHCIRGVMFGHEPIVSAKLEEVYKKIIQNCQGRYIPAAKALLFLLKTVNTVEQWSKIAMDKENPIFMVADEISEISKIKTEMQSYEQDCDDNTRARFVLLKSIWFGLPYSVEDMKMKMHPERYFSKMQIISLFGMAGIGKTTFARKIFTDDSVMSHFDHRVWVTFGPKYRAGEILVDILVQIYPSIDKMNMEEDEKLVRDLYAQLSNKICLIVLDDLWSQDPLHHLKKIFTDIKGTTMVTTRLAKVAKCGRDDIYHEMRLLDEEESWSLLRQKVFGEGMCPPELEKIGRKIADKCEGLPLLILTVADQLLKVEISQESWNNVASGKQKSVFMNAHHQISNELLPSYRMLPHHLKACFLYVGIFRKKYEIPTSNLTNLSLVEAFLETNCPEKEEGFLAECLSELADKSLVMVQHKASDLQLKTCRLHAVFWHLANDEAMKTKFFHAMNSYDDCSIETMKNQRRLSIRNSVLLAMRDVQTSMASVTKARSLLCVSPLQQYPVPLNFDMRLLRVMNALTIRLYEFPVETVRLLQLTYLSLTCNGNLPTSISNLRKLQFFIVKRYMNIKTSESSRPLPVEIWDMKELKHLQIMGGCLPNPKSDDDGLPKLLTLLDVGAQSCTEEVLKCIPNLKRLGIRIELAPGDEFNSFHYLNCIHRLCRLESLKCVVVNPQMRTELVPPPPAPVLMFPSSLKKLSLSGLGYPWEHMSIIGKLENLEVLKLKRYAFEGPLWEIDCRSPFTKLKFLLVEDTNLVQWRFNTAAMMKLEHVCIKHCYKLQAIPSVLLTLHFRKMEIVDCNPKIETWAEEVGQMFEAGQMQVHRSWIADKH